MTDPPLIVRVIVGSIPHGGPIELFLIPHSAPRLVYQRAWYVLSCVIKHMIGNSI